MLQMEVLANTMIITVLQYVNINISHPHVVHYKLTQYYMYVNYISTKLEKNKVQYKKNNFKECKPILILRTPHSISPLASLDYIQ